MSFVITTTDPVSRWISDLFPRQTQDDLKAALPELGELDPVAYALQTLGEGLANVLGGLGSAITSAITTTALDFWGWIEDGLNDLVNTIVTGLSDLMSWLGAALADLGNAIVDGLKAAFEVLVDVFQTVWNWLAENVVQPLIAVATDFFAWMTKGAQANLRTVWDAVVDAAPRSPEGGITSALAVGGICAAITIGADVGAAMIDAPHPFKQLGAIMIAQHAIGVIGIDNLARQAFSALFEVAIVKPMVHELNAEFTREIPGPSDLVRFVVREAIVPEEFNRQMRFHGFSTKWSDAYWWAHWELVARGELTDMLHRGIIDMDTYVKQLVLHDYQPEQTEWLVANTYRLPSRAEITSLLEVSDPTDEQIEMWLTADGISAELLPTYVDLVKSRRLLRVKTRLETLVRRGLREGYFSEAVFVDTMREWNFPEKIVQAELKLAKMDFDLDTAEDLKKMWVEAYRKAEVDDTGLVEELLDLGMNEDRVGIILSREQIRLLPKPKK